MQKLIIWCKPNAKYILAIWIMAIIIVSSIPHLPTLKIHTTGAEFRLDYLFHFCEYGIMAFLSFLSFASREFKVNYKKWVILTMGLILFAVLDELHQKLIPGRTCSIKDVASDVTGILAAVVFTLFVFRYIEIRLKKSY
jgi:VanZ family protein